MPTRSVQISAVVSPETKRRLGRLSRATGVKQGRLIEDALHHHMQALDALPTDVIVPARIVVDRETGERLLERIARPGEATDALRDLFSS